MMFLICATSRRTVTHVHGRDVLLQDSFLELGSNMGSPRGLLSRVKYATIQHGPTDRKYPRLAAFECVLRVLKYSTPLSSNVELRCLALDYRLF